MGIGMLAESLFVKADAREHNYCILAERDANKMFRSLAYFIYIAMDVVYIKKMFFASFIFYSRE